MSDVAKRTSKIIADTLGVPAERVKPEASFCDDLGADPLDGLEIIMALEDEFGVEIKDETANNISGPGALATVGGLIRHVESISDASAKTA